MTRRGTCSGRGACAGNDYTYDAENRLISTAGVSYTYDGDGRRVMKDQTSGSAYDKLYWYGAGSEVMLETDLAGNDPHEYVFFNGKRVARRGGGAIHYFFSDHLGSARVVTNATGGIVEESDFYPFGGERVIVDSLDNNYKFTGHERDSESGLDHMKARHFASSLGRFLQPDEFTDGPVELFAELAAANPTFYANPANPQSLNKYTYTYNNPLRYIDPTGHSVDPPMTIHGPGDYLPGVHGGVGADFATGGWGGGSEYSGSSVNDESESNSTTSENVEQATGAEPPATADAQSTTQPQSAASTPTKTEIQNYVTEQAKAYGVPTEIALATVQKESSFNVNAQGEKGEVGLMQINPSNFGKTTTDPNGKGFKIDGNQAKSDWKYNVRVGMSLLRDAYKFALSHAPGDVARATYARYNAWSNWHLYKTPGNDVYKNVQGFYEHYLDFQKQLGR
jgi:RHS repeat-associated protein